jgi:hypothetical protein
MKKMISSAALISAIFAMPTAFAGAVYDYRYTFTDGNVVSGSFTGTAAGNLITGLSAVSAYVNGVALSITGKLFVTSFRSSEGIASFDGMNNDFVFVDVDPAVSSDRASYFYDIEQLGYQAYLHRDGSLSDSYAQIWTAEGKAMYWSVKAANAVPEPGSMLLLGLGFAGLLAARRKSA